MKKTLKSGNRGFKVVAYVVCIFLAILSIMPFVIMVVNSTRSTVQIQAHAVSLIPSHYLMDNFAIFDGKTFDANVGFINSLIISVGATALTVYFAALTAYALVAYEWKLRGAFFTMILCVMMIPNQVTSIGFYQFMYKIHLTNNFLPLILPGIAAPATVFFMRQFMLASLPLELLDSARIDGSGEFYTFNRIILPMMKPALAVQMIFSFVTSWNNYFMPALILDKAEMKTVPLMIAQLRSADYSKFDMGKVYMFILLAILPVIVVYMLLSKYIIKGVTAGSVKG